MDKLCLGFKLMKENELLEFVILLLIENRSLRGYSLKEDKFNEYIDRYSNINKINKRYKQLLDKFLNDYALNKTEKSD